MDKASIQMHPVTIKIVLQQKVTGQTSKTEINLYRYYNDARTQFMIYIR